MVGFLSQFTQTLTQQVLAQVGIGHSRTYYVFTETAGLNTQLPQHCQQGRERASVALQFDDYSIPQVGVDASLMVLYAQLEVNGHTLRLCIIDQRDAREEIAQRRNELVKSDA